MGSPNHTDALIADIRAAPDDDGPRLVWADAVGGVRGELVVIQVQLERGGLEPRDTIRLRQRQRALLARHGAEWSGLRGLANRVSFRRGFVDAADIDVPTFLAHAGEIVDRAPLLTALTAVCNANDRAALAPLHRLFADPATRRLHAIDIVGALAWQSGPATAGELDGDEAIGAVMALGFWPGLRALGIRGTGSARRAPILQRGALRHLERLALRDYLPPDGITTLLRAGGLESLRALALGRADLVDVAPLIPPRVVELDLDAVDDAGLAALAASPVAMRLERLAVTNARIASQEELFAVFPRLRALAIDGALDDPEFAARPMPALRELALGARIGLDATRRVVRALGPQLELLDLRGNPHALRYLNELKPLLAGELLVGDRRRAGLLRIGPTTQMPWWDHVAT